MSIKSPKKATAVPGLMTMDQQAYLVQAQLYSRGRLRVRTTQEKRPEILTETRRLFSGENPQEMTPTAKLGVRGDRLIVANTSTNLTDTCTPGDIGRTRMVYSVTPQ